LLKDGFDGPELDATLWSRPGWLVENHKSIGVKSQNGHLVISGPAGSTNDWTGHGVNTWDYYEFKRDGSAHLVDREQYAAVEPFAAPPVTLDPVAKLLDTVLASVGACKPSRDLIDLRIAQSVRDKSSYPNASGPWPDPAQGAPLPPLDSDHDGMPDAWEIARGLDPRNANDGPVVAANGYTNLENYLNGLAGDPIPR
jgi:hypothetical protein